MFRYNVQVRFLLAIRVNHQFVPSSPSEGLCMCFRHEIPYDTDYRVFQIEVATVHVSGRFQFHVVIRDCLLVRVVVAQEQFQLTAM